MAESLLEALHAKLIADQSAGTFYDDLGGRVYSLEAPVNASMPLAVILPFSYEVEEYYDQKDAREAEFQITLWGHRNDGIAGLLDTNTKLYNLLHRASLSPAGMDRAVVTCLDEGVESIEEDGIQILSQWRLEATDA